MNEDICEGCNRTDELTYNRYTGMMLCDFCYQSADEEEDSRDYENNWDDGEVM